MQTPQYQALFRERFIALLNAAMCNNAYTRHVPKVHDPLDSVAAAERPRSKARSSYPSEVASSIVNTIKLLSDDFCLGFSYIRNKRGETGIEEYLRAADIETIVLIGKKLRTEHVEARAAAMHKSNTCVSEKPEGYLCGKVREYEYLPSRLTDNAQINAWNSAVDDHDAYIAYAKRVLGITLSVCNTLMLNKRMHPYYEHMMSYGKTEAGFLELAVFARVFCARHGTQPRSHILIPDSLFPAFEAMFTFVGKFWNMRPEEIHALKASCETVFPDDPMARELLGRCIHILIERANSRIGSMDMEEPFASPLRILKIFPDPDMQLKAGLRHANTQEYVVMQDILAGGIAGNAMKPQSEAFVFSAQDITGGDQNSEVWLPDIARAYPSGIEWHPVLLDCPPSMAAEVIGTLFSVEDVRCSAVASELVVFLLSLDATILESKQSLGKILQSRSTHTQTSEYLQALRKAAKPHDLHYAAEYVNVLMKTESPEGGNTVADYMRLMDDASPLPILHCEYWHPLLSKSRWGLEKVHDVLLRTQKNDLPKTINYLIQMEIWINEADWAQLLWKLHHGTLHDVDLLRNLLAFTVPDAICEGSVILHYIAVESGIREYLATIDPERYSLKRDTGFLDLPMEMFLDMRAKEIAPLDRWRTGARIKRCHEEFGPALRKRMLETVEVYSKDTMQGLFDDMGISPEFTDFFLTSTSALTRDDLRLVTGLCADDGHGLLLPITRKALASSPDIQEKLLTGALRAADAAEVTCAILGELARKGNDQQTIGQLAVGQWKTRIPLDPKRYALIHRVCSNATLRNAIVGALHDRDPNMPLRELSAYFHPSSRKKKTE